MDNAEKVYKFKALMAQKDSTSKFVALFLLLQILQQNPSSADTCWQSVEPAFLDKLILAKKTENTSVEEAADLQAMGASILQAFSSFDLIVNTQSFIKRSNSITTALITSAGSESEVPQQLWQVLHKIASNKDGAISILTCDKFLKLANVIFSQGIKIGVTILTLVALQAVISEIGVADVFSERVLAVLELATLALPKRTAIYTETIVLLRCIYSAIPHNRLNVYIDEKKATSLTASLSGTMQKPQKGADHSEELILLATLLRFGDQPAFLRLVDKGPTERSTENEQNRFFLLVCTLSSAEIRSSLANMIGKPNDENYAKEAQKIAACFDIVRRVCLYLVTTESLPLAADDILKIRDNFSATFGETISYLRDRWDSSPLCATADWHGDASTRKSWTIRETLQDLLLLSSSQSLCLWLQEDESLHNEACGLMDVFLGLVQPDLQSETDYGREQFSFFNGYKIIRSRLESLNQKLSSGESDIVTMAILQDAAVELEILRHSNPGKTAKWEETHKSLIGRIEMAAA